MVWCGGWLAAVKCADSHEVYTWGDGQDGRLGHGFFTTEYEPRVVLKLQEFVIVDICAGGAHSAAITGPYY